jgi:hypothetical protein
MGIRPVITCAAPGCTAQFQTRIQRGREQETCSPSCGYRLKRLRNSAEAAGLFMDRPTPASVSPDRPSGMVTGPSLVVGDHPPNIPQILHYEEALAAWDKEIGKIKDAYREKEIRKLSITNASSNTKKILVIPDLHAPFHDCSMVTAMLEREADADIAVVMGDMPDGYSASRFVKYENVPWATEWAAVTLLMEQFSNTFPEVVVITGNHDARLEKMIRSSIPLDVVDAIKYMTGGILDPMKALVSRFPNVSIASRHVSGYEVNWFHTIGDAVFSHAEKYSRVPGSALRNVEEWFSDFSGVLSLDPYRVIFQAHTHTMARFPWRSDKELVEVGALCQTHGYMLNPRIGGRPQRQGYVTFEQTDGVTDVNSIRMVRF